MPTPSSKSNKPSIDAEVQRGSRKSSLTIKRTAAGKAVVQGDFVFRTLRYRLEGTVDIASGRLEPFTHQLSGRDGVVFEMCVISGSERSRLEIQLGKSVQGPRALVLDVQPLAEGVLVGGFVDGEELLPQRSAGCGCQAEAAAPQRPLLSWQADGSTRPVAMVIPQAVKVDLHGLVKVMQATVARLSGGIGLGDIFDIFDWVLCYIECAWELLWCWIRQPDIPGTDGIFDTLCFVVLSGCLAVCRIKRPF